MSDITACKDTQCPLKNKCYRFTCYKNPYRQSYFYKMKENIKAAGTKDCVEFWDNSHFFTPKGK